MFMWGGNRSEIPGIQGTQPVGCSREAVPVCYVGKLPPLTLCSGIPLSQIPAGWLCALENSLNNERLFHISMLQSEWDSRGLIPNCSASGQRDKRKLDFGSCFGGCWLRELKAAPPRLKVQALNINLKSLHNEVFPPKFYSKIFTLLLGDIISIASEISTSSKQWNCLESIMLN